MSFKSAIRFRLAPGLWTGFKYSLLWAAVIAGILSFAFFAVSAGGMR